MSSFVIKMHVQGLMESLSKFFKDFCVRFSADILYQ